MKVSHKPFDSMSISECRSIFVTFPDIRGMCLRWFDGSENELLSSPGLMRRFVVRAMKETSAEAEVSSYGGTSVD